MKPKTHPIVSVGVRTPPTAPAPKNRATENIFKASIAEISSREKSIFTSPRMMCAPLPVTSGYHMAIAPTAIPAAASLIGRGAIPLLLRSLRVLFSQRIQNFASRDAATPRTALSKAVWRLTPRKASEISYSGAGFEIAHITR